MRVWRFLGNRRAFQCSSASRKFLNRASSSARRCDARVSVLFSEPKIPQTTPACGNCRILRRFSALQRAENSSMLRAMCRLPGYTFVSVLFSEPKIPQSTSCVSSVWCCPVSVLFSEPKIPQRACARRGSRQWPVSVLFSEPKIPQFSWWDHASANVYKFQCSSASRKFLNDNAVRHCDSVRVFQCSSASRKFLNVTPPPGGDDVSCFSALQRAENSSNCNAAHSPPRCAVSVLFSEPKIPQSSNVFTTR